MEVNWEAERSQLNHTQEAKSKLEVRQGYKSSKPFLQEDSTSYTFHNFLDTTANSTPSVQISGACGEHFSFKLLPKAISRAINSVIILWLLVLYFLNFFHLQNTVFQSSYKWTFMSFFQECISYVKNMQLHQHRNK